MSRIPRELIKHLEWHAGQEVPVIESPKPSKDEVIIIPDGDFTIDDLIKRGKEFYDDSLPTALRNAKKHATPKGIVATMPHLISGRALSDKSNYLWQNWFTAQTEENIGIDKKGTYTTKGKPVLIIVHGEGILTPERIEKTYEDELTNEYAAKLAEQEIDDLLEGKLPNGENIKLHSFKDFKKETAKLPLKYGIVIDFAIAKKTKSDYHNKKAFLKNPLVIARAGGEEYLERYFDKQKSEDEQVGNWHPFNSIDPLQYQGRLLFLYSNYNGLNGNYYLYYFGRFVGVAAPEAPVGAPRINSRKK